MQVVGTINGVKGIFLLDTGATTEFIDEEYAKGAELTTRGSTAWIKLADGTIAQAKGGTGVIRFELESRGGRVATYRSSFQVTKLSGYSAILGMSWFRQARPRLIWEGDDRVWVEVEQRGKRRCTLVIQGRSELMANVTVTRKEIVKEEEKKREETPRTQQQQEIYERLIKEYSDVFPKELPEGLPPKREGLEHEIKLKDHTKTPYRRPYKSGPAELEALKKILDDMLKKGFIQRSQSRYGAPVLLTPKKDGGTRMVVDYREINKITVKNGYPLPAVDELFPIVQGAKVFSKIDLHSGYYQIRIAEKDREKTAFVTRYGSYEFLVLPMGLCNSPGTFMELMNWVFEKQLDKYVIVFLDDVLIFSKTEEEHEQHMKGVLQILRDNKLYAKMSKCDLVREEVDFLGHRLGRKGLGQEAAKTKDVVDWEIPKSKKQVQKFLGLANYYRKFVKGFSDIARPLNRLTGLSVKFEWGETEQRAFEGLKRALCTAPVLALPDGTLPFVINSDASDEAVGAVLQQDRGKGLQPVAYFSATLTETQKRYPTHEQEMLAIVEALQHWRHWVVGGKVKVRSDHHSLQDFFTQRTLSKRQARWMEALADYDLEIKYVKGKSNGAADALSRKGEKGKEEGTTFKQLGWEVALGAVRRTRRRELQGKSREECIKEAEQNVDRDENRPAVGEKGVVTMPTQRCTASNRKGGQCRARTRKGQYCWTHLKQREGTRIKQSALGKAAGEGLFAARDFDVGERIAYYTGDWLYDGEEVWGGNYILYWNEEKSIDAARTNAAPGRYVNDPKGSGRGPNARFSYDRRNGRASIRATKRIKQGEEILVSYGQGYWAGHGKMESTEERQEVDLTAVKVLDAMHELQKECVIDVDYNDRRKKLEEVGGAIGGRKAGRGINKKQ